MPDTSGRSSTEVLIVGAGPTGLVLALELATRGIRVRVVEKSPGPRRESRAMAVHARTLELYRRTGLADEMVKRGIPIRRMSVRDGSRGSTSTIDLRSFGDGRTPYPFILSIPQDEHESMLCVRLRRERVAVEWNTELLGFAETDHGVRATVRRCGRDESMEALWLCGCDGIRSIVRDRLRVPFAGDGHPHFFYAADLQSVDLPVATDVHLCLGTSSPCVLFPIRNTGAYRLNGVLPSRFVDARDATIADLRPHVERLIGAKIGDARWFATYRVHRRVAQRFRAGRVFLAGDAAHAHSPAGSQGMNAGIADAVNLGWKLAAVLRDRAPSSLLETYETERRPLAGILAAQSAGSVRSRAEAVLRRRLLRSRFLPFAIARVAKTSWFQSFAFDALSQTRTHYGESSVAGGRAGVLRGGDRLPWVSRIDNFAPLSTLDWQIHAFDRVASSTRQLAKRRRIPLLVLDWCDEARAAGFVRDGAYLVRPDAHLGAVWAGTDTRGLELSFDLASGASSAIDDRRR